MSPVCFDLKVWLNEANSVQKWHSSCIFTNLSKFDNDFCIIQYIVENFQMVKIDGLKNKYLFLQTLFLMKLNNLFRKWSKWKCHIAIGFPAVIPYWGILGNLILGKIPINDLENAQKWAKVTQKSHFAFFFSKFCSYSFLEMI